jgi:hypothetical protein
MGSETMTNEYDKQANDFAVKYGVSLTVLSSEYKCMQWDNQKRTVFKLRLERAGVGQYTFEFGQSIAAGNKEPSMYSVLACLQDSNVGSFECFCDDYGYDVNSRKAERTYRAVCKEYAAMERLFSDCMDELAEIQ